MLRFGHLSYALANCTLRRNNKHPYEHALHTDAPLSDRDVLGTCGGLEARHVNQLLSTLTEPPEVD